MAELYHHGILGQKWGVQNGPPYPLGSGEHSKSIVNAYLSNKAGLVQFGLLGSASAGSLYYEQNKAEKELSEKSS